MKMLPQIIKLIGAGIMILLFEVIRICKLQLYLVKFLVIVMPFWLPDRHTVMYGV
jgi:hypothetical protein